MEQEAGSESTDKPQEGGASKHQTARMVGHWGGWFEFITTVPSVGPTRWWLIEHSMPYGPQLGRVMWKRIVARTVGVCCITGEDIPAGSFAYRPLTTQTHRYLRLSQAGLQKLITSSDLAAC